MSDNADVPAPAYGQLVHAVRSSHVLDRALKKHWLDLLPYLDGAGRADLYAILIEGETRLAGLDRSSSRGDGSARPHAAP